VPAVCEGGGVASGATDRKTTSTQPLPTLLPAPDRILLVPEGALYVTARQLAHRYQVSTKWVAARAVHLGATPISDACNSPLRFHLATADAYMDGRRRIPPGQPKRTARSPREAATTRTGAPLLRFG
jgi:hypothetical protein